MCFVYVGDVWNRIRILSPTSCYLFQDLKDLLFRNILYSNHPFSGAMSVSGSGRVTEIPS